MPLVFVLALLSGSLAFLLALPLVAQAFLLALPLVAVVFLLALPLVAVVFLLALLLLARRPLSIILYGRLQSSNVHVSATGEGNAVPVPRFLGAIAVDVPVIGHQRAR